MLKKTVLLFLIVLLVPFVLFAQDLPRTGAEMVAEMGRGINLGNVLSAPSEGDWASPVTEQYFIDVKNAGFTNVRIPVDFFGTRTTGDWSGESTFEGDNSYSVSSGTSAQYTGETFTIDNTYLTRVKQVIDWSLSQGLVTILDFHGQHLKSDFIKTFKVGEGAETDPTSARRAADNAKFRAIWTQLASTFQGYSYKLVFEIINEPYFYMSKDDMDTLNADILAIIRLGGNNPTRNIILTGGGETSYNAITQLDPALFTDTPNRLIGTFHYYNPYNFTSSSKEETASGTILDDMSWGEEANKVADEADVDGHFTKVKDFADDNNSVPVFLGEFGADNTGGYNYSTGDLNAVSDNSTGFADGGPDNTSKVAYMKYVAELAITNGFAFAAWDSGPKSNKTIHKRTDNPSTVNYKRSEFSVTTYSPKLTTVSTVLDTSVWVEDVRYALVNPLSNSKNLLSQNNPTFTSGTGWSGNSPCSGDGAGTYDLAVTHTADGSGSWKINACENGNNRMQTSSAITVPTAGSYTFTFYVKGQANQVIAPFVYANISGTNTNTFSDESDYTIQATDVWEKVVRTFSSLTDDDASVRVRLKTVNTSVHVDDVSLVLTSDAELITSRSAITSSITSFQNGDWEDTETWVGGVVPDSHKINVTINHQVVIKSAVTVNDLTLGTAGKLTINATKSINIANNLDINNASWNSIVFNVGGSSPALLKIGGTYGPSGNRIYYRHRLLSTSFNQKWLLIASPLENATINNFINNSTVVTSGLKTAFAAYDDGLSAGSKYDYVANPYPNTTDVLGYGRGYATQLDAGSSAPTLEFKGKIQDASPIDFALSYGGDGFNLVGNPYSTWLFANKTATSATNNLLTANTTVLEEETIWIWDSLSSTYITKNQDDDAFRIAPTQGFFIQAKNGASAGSFSFAENMQTLTTQTYYRTSNTNTRFEINLFAATNDDQRNTTVRYINNRTTSFDNGSDSSLFGGDDLSIYTELVENNTGKKLAIQSLPNSNFENMVIPVGVSIAAGSGITFTADALNVPAKYNVYLEDRANNTVTRLDEVNAEYKVSVGSGNTNGRFYLHVRTSSVLSTDTNILSTVSMYTTSNSNLRVQGLQEGNASISIFNILGKQVFQTSFDAANSINIALPNLAKGFYLLQLQNAQGKLNKKIILE
ncbi:cellulase family glycosylhydrolase [Polaribacter sp.]|nr:cellulase family glycosylhydrolase [Polaribacter sp.]